MPATLPKIMAGKYWNIGSADTHPLGFNGKIVGDSPLVIIERNFDDIVESLIRNFDLEPSDRNLEFLTSCANHLSEIESPNMMRVKFDDLSTPATVVKIIKFCGGDLDHDHIKRMMGSRIQVLNNKLELSNHAFNDFIR